MATEDHYTPRVRLVALHVPRIEGQQLVFETFDKRISISGHRRLILRILGMCSGHRLIEDVLQAFPPSKRMAVWELIRLLEDHNVLVRTENLPLALAALTSNSKPFMFRELSEDEIRQIEHSPRFSAADPKLASEKPPLHSSRLLRLLMRRKSCEELVQHDAPLDLVSLTEMARVAYGNIAPTRKVVASAGNLHPLTVFLVHRVTDRNDGGFKIYWYDDRRDAIVFLKTEPYDDLVDWFLPAPLIDEALDGGAGLIVICGDLTRTGAKYASRGFRYVLFEAGAASQNMYLLGAERSIGIRAIGGFNDDRVARALELPTACVPLLVMIVTPNAA